MIKYLSTIVLTVALCCACDGEDFSADPTIMPPATQTGANTFGCLIDGWVYTGQRYDSDDKASYYPARNEDEKAIVSIDIRVDNNASISSTSLTPKRKTSLFTVSQKERVTIRLSILMLYSRMRIIKKKTGRWNNQYHPFRFK